MVRAAVLRAIVIMEYILKAPMFRVSIFRTVIQGTDSRANLRWGGVVIVHVLVHEGQVLGYLVLGLLLLQG